jgi:hypothetical protein
MKSVVIFLTTLLVLVASQPFLVQKDFFASLVCSGDIALREAHVINNGSVCIDFLPSGAACTTEPSGIPFNTLGTCENFQAGTAVGTTPDAAKYVTASLFSDAGCTDNTDNFFSLVGACVPRSSSFVRYECFVGDIVQESFFTDSDCSIADPAIAPANFTSKACNANKFKFECIGPLPPAPPASASVLQASLLVLFFVGLLLF